MLSNKSYNSVVNTKKSRYNYSSRVFKNDNSNRRMNNLKHYKPLLNSETNQISENLILFDNVVPKKKIQENRKPNTNSFTLKTELELVSHIKTSYNNENIDIYIINLLLINETDHEINNISVVDSTMGLNKIFDTYTEILGCSDNLKCLECVDIADKDGELLNKEKSFIRAKDIGFVIAKIVCKPIVYIENDNLNNYANLSCKVDIKNISMCINCKINVKDKNIDIFPILIKKKLDDITKI